MVFAKIAYALEMACFILSVIFQRVSHFGKSACFQKWVYYKIYQRTYIVSFNIWWLSFEKSLLPRESHFSKVSQFRPKWRTFEKCPTFKNTAFFKSKLISSNIRKTIESWNHFFLTPHWCMNKMMWCRLNVLPSISTDFMMIW